MSSSEWSLTWVVKTSKLCNLRCSYCYEWDELDNPTRMSRRTWLKLLDAVAEYHDLIRAQGRSPRTSLVLHGGEPLVMPQSELSWLATTFTDRFGDRTRSGEFRLGVQTNLFRLTDDHITLFREHRISVGVSFDGVPGVRANLNGLHTEDRVRNNMGRLAQAGVPFGLITVLAAHTAPYLEQVYEWVVRQQLPWRVLPLFDGPESRDDRRFAIDQSELVATMCRLFERWFNDGASHPLDPLSEYLQTAVKHLVGIRPRLYDRAVDGDGVFVVNLDGRLYRVVDGYDVSLALGSVAEQSMADLLQSSAYIQSLSRDVTERARYCIECQFAGPCAGWHIYEARQTGDHQGRCPLAYPVIAHIQERLLALGYDRGRLLHMTDQILAEPQSLVWQ
jgi:uncharacterized protein